MIRSLIWIIFLIGGAVLGIIVDLSYFRHLFMSILFHIITVILGIIVLKMVMVISRNTGRYLAKNGRKGNLPKLETNTFVRTGMYGCMRHPMHFGLLFFPLAFAFILGSPTFILIIAPFEMILILIMIKLMEEPEAIKKFGDEYKEYMKKVPMFSLKRACLKLLFEKQEKRIER